MPPAPLPEALRLLAPALNERLGGIIESIQALIAHHFLRHPIFCPIINPLWHRLNRAKRCLVRLAARIEAGKPFRASRAGHPRKPRARPAPPPQYPPIPRTHGWLLKALAWHVAVYRYRLERLLAEPGMADLVAATPSLGRILRPLGHMLALPMPALRPKRPTRVRPAQPKPPLALAAPPPTLVARNSEAILPRRETPTPNTTSPFRSLTIKRERYICRHSNPA